MLYPNIVPALILSFIFIGLIMIIIRRSEDYFDEGDEEYSETVTTTTTTVTESAPEYEIHGELKAKFQGKQRYVIDPVDRDKVWLNSNDDMYEDGAGRIWRLI